MALPFAAHISGSFLNREKNQEFTPFSLAQQQLQEKLTPPKSVHSVGKSPKVKSSGKKVSLDDLKAEVSVHGAAPVGHSAQTVVPE